MQRRAISRCGVARISISLELIQEARARQRRQTYKYKPNQLCGALNYEKRIRSSSKQYRSV